MSDDDLVERLRAEGIAELDEAADRIEKLEAALREITTKDLFGMDWAIRTACKALEGKDE